MPKTSRLILIIFDFGVVVIWLFNVFDSVRVIEAGRSISLSAVEWLRLTMFPLGWAFIRLRLLHEIRKRIEMARTSEGSPEKSNFSIVAYVITSWAVAMSMIRP